MPDHAHLIRPLLSVLDQGTRLVEGLEAETYARCPEPLSTAAVGAHLRHCLDFVQALVRGLETGTIDYDAREREPAIETDPEAALARFARLRRDVARLQSSPLDPAAALRVRMDAPEGAPEELSWSRSSVGRELGLVMSHTVHHYALIAMTLRHFGVDPGPDFGVAPSTLAYWKAEGRCAPLPG